MNKVCVEGQRIYFYRRPEPIPKSQVNFSKIEFYMDETWGSFLSVVAQFIQGGKPRNVQVKDGYCFVPPELEVGAFELCLRGDDGESVVASVNRLTFEVCEGFDPSGETPLPPSPDLYTQLIKEIDSGKKIAQSVRKDADAGLFNGERGADGGWYTPSVTQTDENTLRMDFTPSKGDMPDVEHTNIMLPDGGGGGITITNTAAIGQTVKITAVDENGQPTEWEAVDMAEQVHPDWNQNDSTAADYVKNRTHYEESTYIDYVLNTSATEIVGLSMPEVGETITVKINGVESAETVKEAESGILGFSYKYIGNIDFDSLQTGGTGWLVVEVKGHVSGFANPDTTITVETIVLHKINDKFINFDGLVRTFDYYFEGFGFTTYKTLYNDDGDSCDLYITNNSNIIFPEPGSQLFGFMSETGFSEVGSNKPHACFVTGFIIDKAYGSITIKSIALGTNTSEIEELASGYGFVHTTKPNA